MHDKVYCLQYIGGKCIIGTANDYTEGDAKITLLNATSLVIGEYPDKSRAFMMSFVKMGTRDQTVTTNIEGNNALLTVPYIADDNVARVYLDFVHSGMFEAATESLVCECGPLAEQEEKRTAELTLIKFDEKVH